MIRFLIPIILIVLTIVLARRYILSAPIEQQKSRKITVLLLALTIGLLILTLFHRMHWLAATVPALVLVGRKIFQSLSTVFNRDKDRTTQSPEKNNTSTPHEDEAMKVLGLQNPYTKEDVIDAHRKLMQKLHPDRGGNDYLAAKINDAKEVLLKNL